MNERASLNLPSQIQMMLDGSIPPPPIANLIGFRIVSIGSGKAIIEFEAGDRHANPIGTLHGGVLSDISDAAMGLAYASILNEGESKSGHSVAAYNWKSGDTEKEEQYVQAF